MKRLILVFLLSALCIATIAVAGKKLAIDNFSDANRQSLQGGWWYVYDDSGKGGESKVTPLKGDFKTEKADSRQGHAARIRGITGKKLSWDFVGMGVTLTKDSGCPTGKPVDISKYSTLEFKVKGKVSGGNLAVVLPYVKDGCKGMEPESKIGWADYQTFITPQVTENWKTVKLNLRKDFKQPVWAQPHQKANIEDVLKNMHIIHWHFSSPAGDALDLWVDDVVLY